MNIFKKALIVALSVGLISVPTVTKEVEAASMNYQYGNGTIYFKAGSTWENNKSSWGATGYYMYSWDSSNTWDSLVALPGHSGYYYTSTTNYISNSSTKLIFTAGTGTGWNAKKKQSGDITIPSDDKRLFYKDCDWWDTWTESTQPSKTYWKSFYPYSITFDYGTDATGKTDVINLDVNKNIVDLSEYVPTIVPEGKVFSGWTFTDSKGSHTITDNFSSVEINAQSNISLTAFYADASKTEVKWVINDTVIKTEYLAPSTELIAPTDEETKEFNYRVHSWGEYDKVGNTAMEIKAEEYFTLIDEVKVELGFSYSYFNSLVVVQAPVAYGENMYCIGKTSSGETAEFEMKWHKDCNDEFGKKEFVANVPTNYIKLRFEWRQDTTVKGSIAEFERDFENNATWWNSADNNGKYIYSDDLTTDILNSGIKKYEINSLSDVSLRLGTLALDASGFAGIKTYGIRIAKGDTIANDNYYGPMWTSEEIVKVDSEGNMNPEGDYIRWNAVINNISSNDFNVNFTATAYVEFEDGTKYDIATNTRTISVISAAQTYADTLTGINQYMCQYIVDTYKA